MADLHTHMIHGVDDGAPDLGSALLALKRLYDDGVSAVVATPHLNASRLRGNRRVRADEAWPELSAAAAEQIPELELHRGYEILLDTPDFDLGDEGLRLAGSRFVLVEFHAFTIPQNSAEALARIRARGYVPILAHPERYWGYDQALNPVPEWRDAGTLMQINGGSLLGESGEGIRARAHQMLKNGWVDVIASDNHARPERNLSLRQVWDYLAGRGLREPARLLLAENPHRILKDEMPLGVGPVAETGGLLGRMMRLFKGGR